MNRFDHRLLGVAAGLGYAELIHAGVGVAAGCAVLSWSTAGGRLSPDGDQYGPLWTHRAPPLRLLGKLASWRVWRHPWRWFARAVTSAGPWRLERGRHGDPTQHRGITHWPGVPALWAALAGAGMLAWPGWWWVGAWALIAGWVSHLAGDWLCGREVHGQHGHGIPTRPWWGHRGAVPQRWRGLKSDGWAAHAVALGGAVPASLLLAKLIAGV